MRGQMNFDGLEEACAIVTGARRTREGWEWWLLERRYDRDLGMHTDDYLDGGVCHSERWAAHALCEALGAMFG